MMKRRELVIIGAAPALAQQHDHSAAAAPAASAALKFFSREQHALVDELAEMILPADGHSGGAREARVAAFIDDYVASASAETKQAWTEGLAAIDAEAKRLYKKAFLSCTAPQRDRLLRSAAAAEESPKTLLDKFFVRLKTQAISGYYTSNVGLLKDLQYKGIVPIAAYPACDHPEHQKVTR
jgi:hypothetical protein